MKAIETYLTIKSIEAYANGVHRVTCSSEQTLPPISAGQFAHIKVPCKQLRRPVCVYHNTDREITFIIAKVGEGTDAFLSQSADTTFSAILPLGNGFPIFNGKTNVTVLGGGTGCAPLLKIATDNPELNCTALLGFASRGVKDVYKDDFDKAFKKVYYCTDDGSCGHHGFPTDLLREIKPDVLYVCGALGMVKTAKEYCERTGVAGFVSMEQRMGCGVGACLVCSVKVVRDGEQKLLRACADGPVFPIEEVVL